MYLGQGAQLLGAKGGGKAYHERVGMYLLVFLLRYLGDMKAVFGVVG